MKTFARRIRVRQRMSTGGVRGTARQHVRLSVPRGSRIRIRQG